MLILLITILLARAEMHTFVKTCIFQHQVMLELQTSSSSLTEQEREILRAGWQIHDTVNDRAICPQHRDFRYWVQRRKLLHK